MRVVADIMDGKLAGLGYVRVNRVLEFCEQRGRRFLNEGISRLRQEGRGVFRQVTDTVKGRCREFAQQAETICNSRIADVRIR